jgi:hypothetical protein
MKYIRRCLLTIPDQVLSTFIAATALVILWRGLVSVWNDPPSRTTIATVLFIGIAFGLIAGAAPDAPGGTTNEKKNMGNDDVDR